MKRLVNPWSSRPENRCFACSASNPVGLHMTFWADGDDVVSHWQPDPNYQGWTDTLHGGIQSTLIDEVASWVVWYRLRTAGVTSRLTVSYRHPMMTNQGMITVRGRLREMKRNIAMVEVTLSDAQGQECTRAEVAYYTYPPERAAELFGFEPCLLVDPENDPTFAP